MPPTCQHWIKLLVYFLSIETMTIAFCFVKQNSCRRPGQANDVSLKTTLRSVRSGANLPTNLEWLANDLGYSNLKNQGSIEWFDPSENQQMPEEGMETRQRRLSLKLPLYPIDACYLPSRTDQLINNVQSQNIRMMKDISFGERGFSFAEDNMFCVTLRAQDTGRLCRIGTLMRVVKLDEQVSYNGNEIMRIVATCVPEDRLEILRVDNPIRMPGEYYVARLSPYFDDKKSSFNGDQEGILSDELYQRIYDDFTAVRFLYVNGDGVALRELPPFAAEAVQKIPRLSIDDFKDDSEDGRFWKAAEAWQTLCNTVREGRRSALQSDLNEIMIDAAMKKGGPLNLPVKVEDLPFDVQQVLRQKEKTALQDFHALGMDPCLNFQRLIACRSHSRRVQILGDMIARERGRLQAKESLKSIFKDTENGEGMEGK